MGDKWWMKTSLIPFEDFSSICLSGPSNAGKTEWAYTFLKNISGMFSKIIPQKVLYCYGIWQPKYETMELELKFISCHERLPSVNDINTLANEMNIINNLIILDDLLDVVKSKEMEMLFLRGCHHQGLSVMFITQNIFMQSKYARTIS